MIKFAADAITSFSSAPLRVVSAIGFVLVGFCAVYLGYTLYKRFFTDDTVEGWTSVIVVLLLIGGAQLIGLGRDRPVRRPDLRRGEGAAAVRRLGARRLGLARAPLGAARTSPSAATRSRAPEAAPRAAPARCASTTFGRGAPRAPSSSAGARR